MTKLVKKWLTSIGLDYQLFEAAGIVTPEALASLEVSHFGALGLQRPDDRRKLFFLIQRIRQETQPRQQQQQLSQQDDNDNPPDETTTVEKVEADEHQVADDPLPRSRRLQKQQNEPLFHHSRNHSPPPDPEDEFLSDVLNNSSSPAVSQSFDETLLDDVLNDTNGPSDEDDPPQPQQQTKESPSPHHPSFSKPNNSRSSGLQAPRTSGLQGPRRSSLVAPKSKRTGKPLSSIRDSTELPMSPLTEATLTTATAATNNSNDNRPYLPVLSRTSSESSLQSTQSSKRRPPVDSVAQKIAALRASNRDTPIPYHNQQDEHMRIRVVVRKRLMSSATDTDIIDCLSQGTFGKVTLYCPKTRVDLTKEVEMQPFYFDNVFGETISNVTLYEQSVRNIIPSLFEGESATVFCYGQTGSGKTFTMSGDDHNRGLYSLASLDIFHVLGDFDLSVQLSAFEIYGGKLYDLLNERAIVKCLEDGAGNVQFPGLSERLVQSTHDVEDYMDLATRQRSTGQTSRNIQSSRSHAIVQLKLVHPNGSEFSRLTLMDLAGSERGSDAIDKQTHVEGAEINTSLLALKEVIRALANDETNIHVPFRGSKLTQVLKQSFVSSKTVMIACVSPNLSNVECTLNTLRYADRVKEHKGKPVLQHTPSDVLDDILGPTKGGSDEAMTKSVDDAVTIHKDAVSVMLDMVQEEMKLVSDITNFDAYLETLYQLQDEQLEMIGLLKEQLTNYLPNESFEDLRD